MVWKKSKHGLIHSTDVDRSDIKTRIKTVELNKLIKLAEERGSTVSYLLENGLENMFKKEGITYEKMSRSTEKEYFKARINTELADKVRETADEHGVKITNIFDEAIKHIEPSKAKHKSWAYRIE